MLVRCIREVMDHERGTLTQEWAEPIAAIVVPVKTVSESNQREHWAATYRRNKRQQEAVGYALLAKASVLRIGLGPKPCVHVHLTRLGIGKKKLDPGNLEGSFKHVQDAVARFLGVDDGDATRITWSYGQEARRAYGVRIEFYRRSS